MLISHELFRFVDGSNPCPSSFSSSVYAASSSSQQHLWIRQDQVILNVIFASVTDSVLSFIASSSTAVKVWSTVETMYATRSRTRIIQLKSQLTTIRKDSFSMLYYLQKILSTCDELAVIDLPIHEDDQVLYTLNGLGMQHEQHLSSVGSTSLAPSVVRSSFTAAPISLFRRQLLF